jgi:hypothetical protein
MKSGSEIYIFFSVSNWDTTIQSLVSPLRIQYPTSGYWLLVPLLVLYPVPSK